MLQIVLSAVMFEDFIIEAQLERIAFNHFSDRNIEVEAPIFVVEKFITPFGGSKPNLTLDSTVESQQPGHR